MELQSFNSLLIIVNDLSFAEISVTEPGERYIYEGLGPATLTCHLTAESSELSNFTPLWYKGLSLLIYDSFMGFPRSRLIRWSSIGQSLKYLLCGGFKN